MFGLFKKKQIPEESSTPKRFPPVPNWNPRIEQPIERISDRVRHYSDNSKDFAVFTNGTVVILPVGLSDIEAEAHALKALHGVFHSHPDMNPLNMNDGNILIHYKNDAASIVFADIVEANWEKIENQHQNALATDEVLITPLGPNKFDDFGKKILFGRCFMFMDAQTPKVVKIERCGLT